MPTFSLFHHHPDPLSPEELGDQIWLLKNTAAYTVVAVIEAPDVHLAWQAARCHARHQRLPHKTAVRAGHLLRETLPGDVLLTDQGAWMVVSASELRLLVSPTLPPHDQFRVPDAVEDLAWSPDGQILAAALTGGRVALLTRAGDHRAPTTYRGEPAARLSWSPDGAWLAAGGLSGEVHLFRPAPWRATGSHSGSTGSRLICASEAGATLEERLRALAWSPDGRQICAGRADGSLLCWEATTGRQESARSRHPRAITALAFSPAEPALLLTASEDGTVVIWDEEQDYDLVCFHHQAPVTAAAWLPDGWTVASCARGETAVTLWSQQNAGRQIGRLPLSQFTTREPVVTALACSPDGTMLAASGADGSLQCFDLERLRQVQTYWPTDARRHPIRALSWSPDGQLLASGGPSCLVESWRVGQEEDGTHAPALDQA